MEAKTVVIIEDDEDMRDVISRTLQRDERFVIAAEAYDASGGVNAIRNAQPSLVVLDHYIHGKVMGLDSAPVIKTVSPETKLIVFTEKDMGLEAFLEPEVDAYLRKEDLNRLLPLALHLLGLDDPGSASS